MGEREKSSSRIIKECTKLLDISLPTLDDRQLIRAILIFIRCIAKHQQTQWYRQKRMSMEIKRLQQRKI